MVVDVKVKLRNKKGKDMKYYRLSICMQIEYEYERQEIYFFKTEQEVESFIKTYEKDHTRADGSYIPNIDFIEYNVDTVSYERMKEEITVSEFEEMFNVKL